MHADAAPRTAAQREVMRPNILPHVFRHAEITGVARRGVELGHAVILPAQLIRFPARDALHVRARETLFHQAEFRAGVGALDDQVREVQITLFSRQRIEVGDRLQQNGRGEAEMIREFRDVDSAFGKRPPAEIGELAHRDDVAVVGKIPVHFEQPHHRVGRHPHVPLPARQFLLAAHEPPLGRIRADVTIRPLRADQIIGDVPHAGGQRRIAGARRGA